MVILAIVLLSLYVGSCIYLFGVPESLSVTYYLIEEKFPKYGRVFTVVMVLTVALVLPVWLDNSSESTQFLAFLSCMGLLFVGAAALFRDDFDRNIHRVAAGLSAVAALTWLSLAGLWYLPVIFLGIHYIYTAKAGKKNWVFLAEMAVFLSLLIGLLIKIYS